ncbi:MAG: ATP-binding protein, partial [Planctomycetaceae bacterium]|nr:ATP-binding protein [Planctomycetaceae bacterium]
MSIRKNLEQVWAQLRSQAAVRKDSVTRVQIKNFRGIKDLQVRFPFPVCVLAGANSCGKSTVLFSLGCAYRVPDAPQMFTPQKLFPDFRPSHESDLADQHRGQVEIVFSYNVSGQSLEMLWKRGTNKWDKNFFGRKKSTQPERQVYLHIPEPVWAVGFALEQPLHVVALACSASRILKRLQHTLPKFSNPSEMRSTQKLAQRQYKLEVIDASNIAFAQRILGYEYLQLTLASSSGKDLLVAKRIDESEQDCQYSEYHMSSGERAVIRLSMHLSKLKDALVLIDEIDTGLHPYTQQLLMLELQRLALRNNLQIVCTTHSAVVLETVPEEARIFLERTGGNVFQKEAWRDTIQKSLYGRSQDVLTILCE